MSLQWTADRVQDLLDQPHRLLDTEPWRTWMRQQGGLEQVYARLRALPLSERQLQILELRLQQPGNTNQEHADQLFIHRVTYQRALRSLLDTLATHLAAMDSPAPQPAAIAPRFALPVPMTPLIGRTEELETIASAVRSPASRLITLTGPGGIGKTRLALELAWQLHSTFDDGLAFVPLVSISDPALVLPTLLHALGLPQDGIDDMETALTSYLAPRELCLLLDNAEHLLDAMPLCARLLRHAPQLTIVDTSRVRLDLYGEQVIDVPPFALPPLGHDIAFDTLAANPAIQLFAARARAVRHSFQLTPSTIDTVHRICAQLDGIALAIELAAARLRDYSLDEIASAMGERLTFLVNGPRDVEQRQQTLRNTIDWSYQLLAPAEQAIFAKLGVFPGSFTLAAAQAVVASEQPPLAAVLAALVDKNLLRSDASAQPAPRYELLQTLREYARHQLQTHSDQRATYQRFADYYVAFAEEAYTQLSNGQDQAQFKQLEQEAHNTQIALQWLIHQQQLSQALSLTGTLADFWYVRGRIAEGRRWLDQIFLAAQASAEKIPPLILLETLNAAGFLAYHQGDFLQAQQWFRQNLKTLQDLLQPSNKHLSSFDTHLSLARTYHNLGITAQWLGDFTTAATELHRSFGFWSMECFTQGIANSLCNIGSLCIDQGRYTHAQRLLAQSLANWQAVASERGTATTFLYCAKLALAQGQLAQAQLHLEQAQSAIGLINHTFGLCSVHIYRGALHLHQRDLAQAADALQQGRAIAKEIGNKQLVSLALRLLGRVHIEQGQPEQAEPLLAESLRLCRAMGHKAGSAETNVQRAWAALAQRRYAQSRDLAQAASDLFRAIGHPAGLLSALEVLALLAAADGDFTAAASTWALIHHGRQALDAVRTPLEQRIWEQARATLERQLAPSTLQQLLDTPNPDPEHDDLLLRLISGQINTADDPLP